MVQEMGSLPACGLGGRSRHSRAERLRSCTWAGRAVPSEASRSGWVLHVRGGCRWSAAVCRYRGGCRCSTFVEAAATGGRCCCRWSAGCPSAATWCGPWCGPWRQRCRSGRPPGARLCRTSGRSDGARSASGREARGQQGRWASLGHGPWLVREPENDRGRGGFGNPGGPTNGCGEK